MKSVSDQRAKVEAEIKKLEAMGGSVTGRFTHLRDSAFARFPVVFVLLSSFGVVATLYGFEKVIDQIEFLNKNPLTLLLAGIFVLIVTGSLYKKLS